MQIEELVNLVEEIKRLKCETQRIEIKAGNKGTPERLFDTLASLSNQDIGGVIIFGIDEKKDFENSWSI